MGDWALSSETPNETEDGDTTEEGPGAEVDDSLETRRLRRWLTSMFGTPRKPDADED